MKTLQEKAIVDNQVMKLLKVNSIDHIIARTSLGDLTLRLQKDGTSEDYTFVLDSVVQNKEANQALLKAFNGVLYTL
jgi:hypothetical protein